MNLVFTFLSMFILSFSVQAAESVEGSEILAKRGDGIVTQEMFTAQADKIPDHARLAALRNGERLQNVINTMLIRAQLASDARKAGYHNEKIIKDRMQLAADAELAAAWMEHYLEIQPQGDYEQLAFEYYQINKDKLHSKATEESIDVTHILVSTKERSPEDALALAASIHQQVENDPSKFDSLVKEHSEDPSAPNNEGRFYGVKQGDMVVTFEDAAFALSVSDISIPVKSQFGYHIIRLDESYAAEPGRPLEFEEVKVKLMDEQRKNHSNRVKQDYMSQLSSHDVEMSEEQVAELIKRLFGEDYVDPYASK